LTVAAGALAFPAAGIADAALSANVALKNVNNNFTTQQTIKGSGSLLNIQQNVAATTHYLQFLDNLAARRAFFGFSNPATSDLWTFVDAGDLNNSIALGKTFRWYINGVQKMSLAAAGLTTADSVETTAGSFTAPVGQGYYARRNTGAAAILCMGYDLGTDDLTTRLGGTIWRVRDTGAGVMMSLDNAGLMTLLGGVITGGNVRIPHSSNYAARNNAGTGDINLIGTVAGVDWIVIGPDAASQIIIGNSAGTKLGFYNSAPIALQNVSGSRGGNVALANLFTALQNLGLLVDMTTV
jgi:hypothetical protein